MAHLKELFNRIHYQPLPLWLLFFSPLEWGYRLAVVLRLVAYWLYFLKPVKVPVPVISVGNLTTGGTGKTPVVLSIADGLLKQGLSVVILSRGYGAEEPIEYGQVKSPKQGDEAYFIQQQLPKAVVIVGKDRVKNAQQAYREYRPDLILLDDGFQYLRLHRDLNILLVDGQHMFGNQHLLPLGPVREPLAQINRAHLIFLTKQVTPETVQKFHKTAHRRLKRSIPIEPLEFQIRGIQNLKTGVLSPAEELIDTQVIALSGIAHPDSFEKHLLSLGVIIREHLRYPDHYIYRSDEVMTLMKRAEEEDCILVTTDKDLVKIKALVPPASQYRVHSLKVSPQLDFDAFYRQYVHPLLQNPPKPALKSYEATEA